VIKTKNICGSKGSANKEVERSQAQWCLSVPAHGRLRQENFDFSTPWATYWDTVSKKYKRKKESEKIF
jgi:hypothetical protein